MNSIYFDNAASTPMSPKAIKAMMNVMEFVYGNPSSGHKAGRDADSLLKKSRNTFSEILGVPQGNIFFTSGGTESNNLAIFGAAKRKGTRIISTFSEHPSIKSAYEYLSQNGFEVVNIRVSEKGLIDVEQLIESINENTVLISLSHVNHETGVINDIENLGKAIKKKNEKTLFHVDAVQSFVKHKINISHVDLLSVSSHKIHGPKGVGLLYISQKALPLINPLFHGGGQQKGLRPGTENTIGICGFSAAAEEAVSNSVNDIAKIKKRLLEIPQEIGNAIINGSNVSDSPYITNISFLGIPSQVLQNALDSRNIYISSGAACSSNKKGTENVIFSYGLGRARADSAIRISLGLQNTVEEAEIFIKTLKSEIQLLK